MSVRDDNLKLALTKAIADVVSEAMAHMRNEHFNVLLEQYEDAGTKQFSVKLPDGTKVATITLTEQKEAYEVTDEVAFLQWMRRQDPDGIETVTVPPQPEWTYEQVKDRTKAATLKRLEHVGDMPFDPITGELVEGVTYRPAGRPKGFQVRYESEGRAQVIDAWRTGALAELVGSDVLPQIGSQ
jgi:hypothetical protein